MPVRPFRWPLIEALSLPRAFQQALAFEGSGMRANAHRSPITRAARSVPMTSLAHRTCAVSRAGQPERIDPEIRSARSANRTRGMQHMELRTRARMWTCPFQIPTTLAYIFAVHVAGLYPTWNVLAPDRNRADARVLAMRETRHGPRTHRHVNPAW